MTTNTQNAVDDEGGTTTWVVLPVIVAPHPVGQAGAWLIPQRVHSIVKCAKSFFETGVCAMVPLQLWHLSASFEPW